MQPLHRWKSPGERINQIQSPFSNRSERSSGYRSKVGTFIQIFSGTLDANCWWSSHNSGWIVNDEGRHLDFYYIFLPHPFTKPSTNFPFLKPDEDENWGWTLQTQLTKKCVAKESVHNSLEFLLYNLKQCVLPFFIDFSNSRDIVEMIFEIAYMIYLFKARYTQLQTLGKCYFLPSGSFQKKANWWCYSSTILDRMSLIKAQHESPSMNATLLKQ